MSFVDGLQRVLTAVVDAVVAPTAGRPAVTLLWMAILIGGLLVLVYRWTTDQRTLGRIADRTKAEVLGLRVFRDDLRVALRAHARLLGLTARRLVHSLPPVLVLTIPLAVLLAQLAARYEHRPLRTGESAIVTLHLKPEVFDRLADVSIELPSWIEQESPALRDAVEHSVAWRVGARGPGRGFVRWRLDDERVEKRITASDDPTRLVALSPHRPGPGLVERFLHPTEPPIAAATPVRFIEVGYPSRQTHVLGLAMPWWLTLLLASMLAALLVRPLAGVRF